MCPKTAPQRGANSIVHIQMRARFFSVHAVQNCPGHLLLQSHPVISDHAFRERP
jgi:hypothetical protein